MLSDYVIHHAVRGDCQCGKCFDAPKNPQQPNGHTADLIFFKVAAKDAQTEDFTALAKSEYPHWFDGQEHSYMEIGGDVGNQGLALMTMGLGSLLGTWKLLTPRSVLGEDCPDDLVMQMAGMGRVTIKA